MRFSRVTAPCPLATNVIYQCMLKILAKYLFIFAASKHQTPLTSVKHMDIMSSHFKISFEQNKGHAAKSHSSPCADKAAFVCTYLAVYILNFSPFANVASAKDRNGIAMCPNTEPCGPPLTKRKASFSMEFKLIRVKLPDVSFASNLHNYNSKVQRWKPDLLVHRSWNKALLLLFCEK